LFTVPEAANPLFTASNIRDPRYVWDPTAHKFFGEDLYYFLLRLEEPTEAAMKALMGVCRRAHVKTHTVYRIYGYYDALVRVWCSREARNDLRERMYERFKEAIIVEFLLYQAFFDDWSAHNPDIDDRLIHKFEKDIHLVSSGHSKPSEIKQALRRLTEVRLLHYQNPGRFFSASHEPLIKLYIALTKSPGARGPARTSLVQIAQAVEEAEGFRLKSLYFGEGSDFDCLVKAVISSRDFNHLDGWVDLLYERLRIHGQNLRPMTLLIASVPVAKPDALDLSGNEVGQAGRRLMRLLSPDVASLLPDFPTRERHELLMLFEAHRIELVNTPFERFFLGLFEARLAEDEDLLAEKLIFFQFLERNLRSLFERRLFPEQLGRREWFPRVRNILLSLPSPNEGNSPETPHQPKESTASAPSITSEDSDGEGELRARLSLGQYILAATELAKQGVLDTKELKVLIGEDWINSMKAITDLRNAWAHGSLSKILGGEGWPNWGSVCSTAFVAGRIYNAFKWEESGESE